MPITGGVDWRGCALTLAAGEPFARFRSYGLRAWTELAVIDGVPPGVVPELT
jgi:hypothetical protein